MTRTNTEILTTRGEFESKANTIGQLQLDIARMIVERDEAKEAILLRWNTQIENVKAEIKALQPQCAAYAKTHWPDLAPTPKARSAETTLVTYGFRTGQPTPKLIGKGKEADIAAKLYDDLETRQYVVVKFKLNKAAITKALRAGVAAITKLFKLDQAERFFVEAKATNGK